MKNAFVFFPVLILILSCNKDNDNTTSEPEPMLPVIVIDQAVIEANVVGDWEGIIRGTNGASENVEVTIMEMILGEKVGEGKYFDPTFSCGFEWTYESLKEGRVTFREKTLAPNICFDDLPIKVHFEDDDFDKLRISISIPGQSLSFSGTLQRS